MATLFNCSTDNVGLHLKNIFESAELKEEAVCAKFAHTDDSLFRENVIFGSKNMPKM